MEAVSACPAFDSLLKQALLEMLAGEEMPTPWGAQLSALELGRRVNSPISCLSSFAMNGRSKELLSWAAESFLHFRKKG